MSGITLDHTFAQAIVEALREPLLVLDDDLCVIAASRSFLESFGLDRQATEGKLLGDLGDGAWDIADLRERLMSCGDAERAFDPFEADVTLPGVGRRSLSLTARRLHAEPGRNALILLGFEDITERRRAERERDALLRDKDLLLLELQHRVSNGLQLIASILLMKARAVSSEETRQHLHDAHKRVLAVAAVQRHLRVTPGSDAVDMRVYLTRLCESLSVSMTGGDRPISIDLRVDDGDALASEAVNVGLVVTELVINALKHAFPSRPHGNLIVVSYLTSASEWRLKVCDNGVGKPDLPGGPARRGLGTGIVAALASQLGARVEQASGPSGTAVSLTHVRRGELQDVH